jgi:subtilisin family serine protease
VLNLVNLPRLMSLTHGCADIAITLIDGPVNTGLPTFEASKIKDISAHGTGKCDRTDTFACEHGTLVAGVLVSKRGGAAPAICPGCTLLLWPIFGHPGGDNYGVPSASAEVLATAITEAVAAGTRIINLSCSIGRCSGQGETRLDWALNLAAKKGVIVVAAAGNQAKVGGSCITKHPWVIPVVSMDQAGRTANECTLSASIGRGGLSAPGQGLLSVNASGEPMRFSGTSAACPLVTGAAALLWSEHPNMAAGEIKEALIGVTRQRSLVPPAMDAWGAFQKLEARAARRRTA